MPTTIFYASGLCGSGKTHQAILDIKTQKLFKNILYVVPSCELQDEIATRMASEGITARIINSLTHKNRVHKSVLHTLKNSPESGEVLIITLCSFLKIPYDRKPKYWQVYIDENIKLDEITEIELYKENYSHLLDYIEISENTEIDSKLFMSENPDSYYSISSKDGTDEFLNIRPDYVQKGCREVLWKIASPKIITFVKKKQWNDFISFQESKIPSCVEEYEGDDDGEPKELKIPKLNFIHFINPSFLDGCIMMGANFEKSLLFQWTKDKFPGIELKEYNRITKNLRKVSYSRNTKISYFFDTDVYSKTAYNKKFNGIKIIDLMNRTVLETWKDESFVYSLNNDQDDLSCGERMPVLCHGLNKWDHHDKVYINMALNRTPEHSKMLTDAGLKKEDIMLATAHETIYQGIMRSSIRNTNATSDLEFIVPDLKTARILNGYLGNVASLEQMDLITSHTTNRCFSTSTSPKKPNEINDFYLPSSPYSLRYARQVELKDSKASKDYIQNGISVPLAAESFKPKISAASELKDSMASKTHTHLSILKNPTLRKVNISIAENVKTAYNPSDFQFETMNWQSHINDLSIAWKRTNKDKTNNFALNYSKYKDENKLDGVRQKDNIAFSDALILDFDGGDFSKDDFNRIFNESGTSNQNNKKLKLSFLMYNSFSCGPERYDEHGDLISHPNKFRVIIPFKESVSMEEFKSSYLWIKKIIENNGFINHKIDTQCGNPNQMYYAPCINFEFPEYAFFEKVNMQSREIERYALNGKKIHQNYLVLEELKNIINPPKPERTYDKPCPIGLTSKLQNELDDLAGMTHSRYDVYFSFAAKVYNYFQKDWVKTESYLKPLQDSYMRGNGKTRKAYWLKGVKASLKNYKNNSLTK